MTLQAFASRLSYQFKKPGLLAQALTHRSFGALNNERLEFLGDGALNFIIAHQLYLKFSNLPEGDLSRLRAQLVKESTLCELACQLEIGASLKMGEGELKNGGWKKPSILADAVEAIVGAIYLDGGHVAAEAFVVELFAEKFATIDPKVIDKDPKSLLQELLQSKKRPLPEYNVQTISGEAHAQTFVVECVIKKLNIRTIGEGASRRMAEQQAALLAFAQMEK
jgi:ribonuclease III